MAEVLLKELNNTDIDWLIAQGQRETIRAGEHLFHSGEKPDALYLLLGGALTVHIPGGDRSTACPERPEILRLGQGEIVGETSLFNTRPATAAVKAAEDTLVLVIPQTRLQAKLQQDLLFSVHLYRAIGLMISERLRQMIEMPTQIHLASDQPVKEALFVFSELRDSDVDWLLAAGQLKKFAAGQIVTQAGRPVDALSIVLDGLLRVSIPENGGNLLELCFDCAEKDTEAHSEVSRLSRGEMSGGMSFLEARPALVTMRAIEETLVLAIPRQQLAAKLQQDIGFASRFYRILAVQLLESWQSAIGLMGCPQQMYHQQDEMDADVEYDDELDLDALHQMSQGAARFNWVLKRLGVV